MKINIRQLIACAYVIGLLALSLSRPQALPRSSAQSISPAVENLLNPDGTLNLNGGFNGDLSLQGWNVTLDVNRGPILKRQRAVSGIDNQHSGQPNSTQDAGWSALPNNGLKDGNVFALAVVGTDIYVGGAFHQTQDGAVTDLNRIARFNTISNTWSALPHQGLDGSVLALAVVGSDLYVGGAFSRTFDGAVTDLNFIARFSTTSNTWSPLPNKGLDEGVYAFAVNGSDLYVGGNFLYEKDCFEVHGSACDQFGLLGHIAKFSGGAWSPLPHGGLNAPVNALAFLGDDLFVGGSFASTRDLNPADRVRDLNGIAKFSTNGNSWSALPNKGLSCQICSGGIGLVSALAVIGNDLYVGGLFERTFDNAVKDLNGIARLRSEFWSALPNKGLSASTSVFAAGSVSALAVDGNDLYVGGSFVTTGDHAVADLNGIAKFGTTNTTWSATPNGGLDFPAVYAMAVSGASLFVGGGFVQTADGSNRNLHFIGKLGLPARVEVVGLEVTQGIQNWKNDVPLIDGRATYVRVQFRNTSSVPLDVHGTLSGKRDGVSLGELDNDTGYYFTRPVFNFRRDNLNGSLLFRLPSFWLHDRIELTFSGATYGSNSPPVACSEIAGQPNDCKAQVTFTRPRNMGGLAVSIIPRVKFFPILWYDSNGFIKRPNPTEFERARQQFLSVLPINDLVWTAEYYPGFDIFADAPRDVASFEAINANLKQRRALDGCVTESGCRVYYVGVLVNGPAFGQSGLSSIPSDVFSGYLVEEFSPLSVAFGYALGRKATNCNGTEPSPDPSYPYAGGLISPVTESQDPNGAFFGFNSNTRKIYTPLAGDLMSYCLPSWPSDWTYNHMKDALVSRYDVAPSRPDLSPRFAVVNQPAVLVSGTISATQQPAASISSIYQITAPVVPPSMGSYTIRLETSGGQVLASYPFEPDTPVVGATTGQGSGTSESTVAGAALPFVVLLPWNAAAARIVVAQNGLTLATRAASAHPPTVSIVYPNGGESLTGAAATLHWSASDADNDPLAYTVQYSVDAGVTWQTLAIDRTANSLDVDLTLLPGTNQGLLRVLVTDGFYTTQAQSSATFTVAKHAPQVMIDGPVNNSLYVDKQIIFLEAQAYDLEDGLLGDSALTWSSNRDGVLGTGRLLEVNALTLAAGTHVITLTAKDSDGQTGNNQFVIYVYRLPQTINAIDDAQFFVSQHYQDFLSRTPDSGGFAYWTGQLSQCGGNPACLRAKRIDVSNAFFFELEFQQTGAYVYRLYREAFGNNQPFPNGDPANVTEAKKLPAYAVFASDRARVIGGSDLAQSQLGLANAFVRRPEFLARYPASLTGPQFVDALLATMALDLGVDLTSQRNVLNNLFNQGGRGAVLYRLADDNSASNPVNNRPFIDAEYSRAFVTTEYFGYLRRDSDIGGFLFWLGQVNSGPLHDVAKQHAMVCSFITSAEYQQRFSPAVTHTNTDCPQ